MVIRRLPPNEKKTRLHNWDDFPNLKFGILEFWNEKPFQKIRIFGKVPESKLVLQFASAVSRIESII